MSRLIRYGGEIVGVAGATRFYLTQEVLRNTPLFRFVSLMCLHSHGVDTGEVPGPYTEESAQLFARILLIPDEQFDPTLSDRELAERFVVPQAQIELKRRDLANRDGCG